MVSEGSEFRSEPLRNMVAVGAVDARSARIWMRTESPGKFYVQWWPEHRKYEADRIELEISSSGERDNTGTVTLPPKDGGSRPLEPVTEYRYRVTRVGDGRIVGEGRFETFPERPEQTPSRFSIAFFSCHQPFDKNGAIRPSAHHMLRAANKCLENHRTKFVLEVGDQMYSDYPVGCSLVDPDYLPKVTSEGCRRLEECSTAEVRRLYQQRYRYFWNLPEWKTMHAQYPCYPILDDHELLDNWGSDPNHQKPQWQSVGRGARQAYFDYQGARITDPEDGIPGSFHYSITYGPVSTFVMDLRSERKAGDGGQLFSKDQDADFRQFLDTHSHQEILLIVLSVPVVHLPRYLARIVARLPPSDEDFSDRWSSGNQVYDRDRFLNILHQHQLRNPSQRVLLISGDIHVGCAHKIEWDEGGPPLYQLVSSGITHETDPLFEYSATFLMRMKQRLAMMDGTLSGEVTRVVGQTGKDRNPYGKLNLGILDIHHSEEDGRPNVQFHIYGCRGEEPVPVYRSPVI